MLGKSSRSFVALSVLALFAGGCPEPNTEPTEDGGSDDEVADGDGDDTTTDDTTTDDDTDTTADDTTDGDPECGNGVVEDAEECDDGNAVNDDGCSNECTLAMCGDGIIQAGEGCDAGADNGPGQPCNSMCQPNMCGDGEIGPGEACDDGNAIDDDDCGNDCALASCGDGQIDPGEQCDDGNAIDDDECLNTCVFASCGDGIVYPDAEACDQGEFNSDSAECTSACAMAECGDGLVWNEMEECDLGGANGPTSACLEDCVVNVCGDGFVGPQEGCDDGNLDDDDGCSASCELEGCGDGIVQMSEECDDGNMVDTDDCTSLCKLAACGDGFMQMGEACDDGMANSNTADCTLSCTIAECGDGLVHADDEQCDNGMNNANDAACKADCTDNICGDGFPGPGQACDDGNGSNNDGCTNVCTLASCGDGFPQPGEECDDGNANNADGCTNGCLLPECGDNIVQMGEACDDGNGSNNDACTNACVLAACGDSFTQPGEECDDGNAVNVDGCTNACALPECGDNLVSMGEQCDDGNMANNDGCSPSCTSQGVLQISAGDGHTCVLLEGGFVRCWGYGVFGRTGYGNNGTIGDNEHPYTAGNVNVGGTVVSVGAGYFHTCALLEGGTVRCWGAGDSGRLGYGNVTNIGDNEAPAVAGNVPVGGQVVQLSVGADHTCAVLVGGAVRCWGFAESGRLGYANANNIGDNETPASAGNVNVGGTVVKVAAGITHTCALLQTGAVRCWGGGDGLGYPGQVGPVGDNETPASKGDVNVGGPVADIAAGANFTCAVMAGGGGEVKCWGNAGSGQLGYGNQNNIGDNEHPAAAPFVAVGGPAVEVTTGQYHACAVLQSGAVRCWGEAANGRLGYGNLTDIGDNEVPLAVGTVSLGGNVVDIDADWWHSCAVLQNSSVRCWGYGNFAQLGYANTVDVGDNELPSSVGPVQVY
jgi:cysteine-rich repeat protein